MKYGFIMAAVCFSLLFFGCDQNEILIESETAVESGTEEKTGDLEEELRSLQEEQFFSESSVKEETEEQRSFESSSKEQEEPSVIVVHLCGEVVDPGVYEIEDGTRLYQAVELAGGFTEAAEEEFLNLAVLLEDGMQIRILSKEEAAPFMEEKRADSLSFDSSTKKEKEAGNEKKKVNLNTADETELCTLPGIGESRARAILQYREENGSFQAPEDVMKVSGIKETAYEKIKDLITVSKDR